jgi:hypothetical protein
MDHNNNGLKVVNQRRGNEPPPNPKNEQVHQCEITHGMVDKKSEHNCQQSY